MTLTAGHDPFKIRATRQAAPEMVELLAFTAEHVRGLTGLSISQLRYWDKTEFFSPTLVGEEKRRTFHRVYTFRDVVGLRTIALLRNVHHIPLQELRRVGSWLHAHYTTPWASLRFWLAGRRVVFSDPASESVVDPQKDGQTVVAIDLAPIADDMGAAANALTKRQPDQIGRVVRNRYVVHNAWVVAGTRIPTKAIWNFHAAGFDVDGIVREYPRLTPEDVKAAIEFETRRRNVA